MLHPVFSVHRLSDAWVGAKDALPWAVARDYRFIYIEIKAPRVSLRLGSGQVERFKWGVK